MFNRVTAVVLFVQNFETCLTFYRDTLGLEVVALESNFAAFKMQDQDFAIQGIEPSAAMVNMAVEAFASPNGKAPRALLCTKVEDVDAVYESLKLKGIEFTGPPIDQEWGIRAVYFQDPEGHLWEFAQPLK